MSESDLQKRVNADLRRLGIKYHHIEKGRYNKQRTHRKGIPDLIIFPGDGRAFFCELKAPGKTLTEEQGIFLKWATEMKYNFYVVSDMFSWELVKRHENLEVIDDTKN